MSTSRRLLAPAITTAIGIAALITLAALAPRRPDTHPPPERRSGLLAFGPAAMDGYRCPPPDDSSDEQRPSATADMVAARLTATGGELVSLPFSNDSGRASALVVRDGSGRLTYAATNTPDVPREQAPEPVALKPLPRCGMFFGVANRWRRCGTLTSVVRDEASGRLSWHFSHRVDSANSRSEFVIVTDAACRVVEEERSTYHDDALTLTGITTYEVSAFVEDLDN